MASKSQSQSRIIDAWTSFLDRHPGLEALVDDVRPWLPPLNFVTLHYGYFVVVSLIFSVFFYASSDADEREDVSYVDSLFLVVSAITNTGLNTVDLSALTVGQQGILWVLMTLGSAMWVSFWTVLVRRRKRADRAHQARARKGLAGVDGFALADLRSSGHARARQRGSSGATATTLSSVAEVPPKLLRKILPKEPKEKVDSEPDVGADNPVESTPRLVQLAAPFNRKDKQDGDRDPAAQLLLLEGTADESERLAEREHQALNLLALIIPLYAVLWVLVSSIVLGVWISRHYASAVEEFGGYGYSFLVLFLIASLILAGNTAFPAFLRLMIWVMLQGLKLFTPDKYFVSEKATLLYILKYPRQVYTHLFPARQTWLLVIMLMATMAVDWVAFEVLSIGNPAVEKMPIGPRILDGLFQAISVRGTGFYVVPVSELFTILQVLYMVMMYISAFPIVIAMRHSNVSEDRAGALTMQPKTDAYSSASSDVGGGDEDPELGHLLPGGSGSGSGGASRTPEPVVTPARAALHRLASLSTRRRAPRPAAAMLPARPS
ncbi:unnamed protein product [Parascedosporium putredinis]|uniref:TrkH-domain-containing protein n=1 Tax=Parascedosporium putredinis TaxID=1442378 RepID=A0A9P1MAJ4_9PEZI|nr:unnamed protein product [Parascedosporium putredinis]CAI7994255.1 unnamed protein product [Parascedosporium putredinis]